MPAFLTKLFRRGGPTYSNGASVEVTTVPDYVPLKIDLDFGTGPGKSPVFEYDLNLEYYQRRWGTR